MLLRPLARADRAPLARLLEASGAFTPEEVAVALELIDLGTAAPPDPHYQFVVAAEPAPDGQGGEGGAVLGYACFGEAPMTEGSWDLYWIAVDPATQGRGVGRALLREAEARVAARGGRQLLAETAGKPSYAATRAFYLACDYREVARVPDFYRVGDDKVIYARGVAPTASAPAGERAGNTPEVPA